MTGFPSEVRELVRQRASERGYWACEIQVRCTGRVMSWELHHRRPRGMGGSRLDDTNTPANALGICTDCHSFLESQRGLAYRNGWLVRQHRSPTDIPVLRRGTWVRLNNSGGVIPTSVPCLCGLFESEHRSLNCPCTTYEPDAEAA